MGILILVQGCLAANLYFEVPESAEDLVLVVKDKGEAPLK